MCGKIGFCGLLEVHLWSLSSVIGENRTVYLLVSDDKGPSDTRQSSLNNNVKVAPSYSQRIYVGGEMQ